MSEGDKGPRRVVLPYTIKDRGSCMRDVKTENYFGISLKTRLRKGVR